MSQSTGGREVAHRVFAAEYDDASLEYAESDEERAPNYVVTPTGARVNRLFTVGVLTSVEQVNEDTVRARIADPTGAFVVYAGQYQPDELAALQSMEAPAFVAVTGKANTFQPEGSDRVLTSLRPESVTEVEAETRDRWVVTTAEHTLARIETMADALAREERGDELTAALLQEGVEPGLAEGTARAIEHYEPTADYLGALRELALQAVEVVAGERDEATALSLEPGDTDGSYSVGDLRASAPDSVPPVAEAVGDVPEPTVDEGDVAGGIDESTVGTDEPSAGTGEPSAGAEEAADAGTAGATADATEESPDDATAVTADQTADAAADTATETADASTDAGAAASDAATDDASADDAATDDASTEDASADTGSSATDAGSVGDFERDPSDSGTASTAETSDGETDDEVATTTDDAADSPPVDESADVAEPTATDEDAGAAAGDDADADELYEVDEEERERIESEYGVGFESGTEVEDAGEAGIEAEGGAEPADATDEAADGPDGATEESAGGAAAETTDESADDTAEATEETAEEPADDATDATDEADDEDDAEELSPADIESALIERMDELDEGDGADREELVATVVDETGAEPDAVDDAIQDALMSGRCYEPTEGQLKSI